MRRRVEELAAGMTYLSSSIATTLANKYILTNLEFKMQYLLVALQSVAIVGSLLVLRCLGVVRFRLAEFRRWAAPSLMLTVMIFSGSKSLYYLPISLYTLFKNSSIIVVALLEQSLFKKKIGALSYLSFVLMALGSYMGDAADSVLDVGYVWMVVNILSTTAYVLSLKMAVDKDGKARNESVYYSNLISLPILAALSMAFDERDLDRMTGRMGIWILASSFCAFFTSFSTAWTLNALSSTALSMLGALNKSLGSFAGIAVLGEGKSLVKTFSLLLGAVAATVYSYDISFRNKA